MTDPHTPTYWPDEPQHRSHPDEEQFRREMAERDYGPPATHCAVCGKPLDAQLTCVACGDETDEKDLAA